MFYIYIKIYAFLVLTSGWIQDSLTRASFLIRIYAPAMDGIETPPLVKSHEQLKSEAETYTRYGPWLPENNYGRWKLVKTSTFSARTYFLRIIMHIFDNFTFSTLLCVKHLIAPSCVHPELPVTSWMPKDAQANVGRWSKYFHALARGFRFRASKNFVLEDWWRWKRGPIPIKA